MPFTWDLLWYVLRSFNSQVPLRVSKWRFVSIANYGFTIAPSNLNFHITQFSEGLKTLTISFFVLHLTLTKIQRRNHNNVTGPIAPDFWLH